MGQEMCSNCEFWVADPDDRVGLTAWQVDENRHGKCRRYGPAMGLAATKHDYWCGEWCNRDMCDEKRRGA